MHGGATVSRPFRLLSLVVVAPIVLALLVWYAASIKVSYLREE